MVSLLPFFAPQICMDKTILDIPPRANVAVKLNFQSLEPTRMPIVPRKNRRRRRNADSDSDCESVTSSAQGGGAFTRNMEQELKYFALPPARVPFLFLCSACKKHRQISPHAAPPAQPPASLTAGVSQGLRWIHQRGDRGR